MPPAGPERYAFGEFIVDVTERRLYRGTAALHLPPKAFDVLIALVRHAGQLMTKPQLLAEVWPDTFVEDGILTVYISALRKQLNGTPGAGPYLETVARFGYRFVAPVTALRASESRSMRDRPHAALACELVERGRTHVLAGSHIELNHAVEAFQAAVTADPDYAAAHAGLALARCAQAEVRAGPAQAAYDEARGAALRALALDDRCAEAQLALGTVLFLSEWDWAGAEKSLQRALTIDPEYTEAYLRYGNVLDAIGRLPEGLDMKLRALEHNPSSPVVLVEIAMSCWNQRRYDDTITWARRALELDHRIPWARDYLAAAYWSKRDTESHVAVHLERAEFFGGPAGRERLRSACEAMGPTWGIVRHLLDTTVSPAAGGAAPIRLAMIRSMIGEMNAALCHLDEAIAARDPAVVYLAVSPHWYALRGDARFQERLTRLGLPSGRDAIAGSA